MNRKGLSLPELLFSAAIIIILMGVSIRLFSFASNYYATGTNKVDFHRELGIATALLKRDIREASWDISIDAEGRKLRIKKFVLDSDGVPLYDSKGYPGVENLCEYEFTSLSGNASSGKLLRNQKPIMSSLTDIKFSFHTDALGEYEILRVVVEMKFEKQGAGNSDRFVIHVAPRHLSSWSGNPFWTSITNGQRFKYNF